MVKKVLGLFNRKLSGLHEAAYLLAAFAFLSQVMALIRDRLLASNFGADQQLDIYYAAFRIPDLIYVSIASFVAVTILIPYLLEKLDRPEGEARQFLSGVFTAYLLAIISVCAVAFAAMPVLSHVVAPGFNESARQTLITVSRIILVQPILLGLSNLLGSVTQLEKKFFVFALGPVLYNIGIILGLIFLEPAFGLMGVVIGVVVGAVAHVAIQLPVVGASALLPAFQPGSLVKDLWQKLFTREKNQAEAKESSSRAESSTQVKEIVRVVKTSFPRTISLSITQMVIFILISIASVLSVGAISVFQLAHNLQSVPLAIIGMSYSVAAFPTLASFLSKGRRQKFKRQMISATRHIIFWSLPAVVLFIVLRAQIVRVIFGSGQFGWDDTRLVAAGLALFSVSVTAQSLVLLYARGYYAAGNTRTPLIVNAISAAVIIGLSFVLLGFFQYFPSFAFFIESLLRVGGLSGTAVLMLPLAFSIGMSLNAAVLIAKFKNDFPVDFSSVTKSARQGFYSSITMGAVAYVFLKLLDGPLDLNTLFGIFTQGFVAGVFGIISGVALLWILDNKEIQVVSRTLHKKFWRGRTLSSSHEDLVE